MITTRSILLIAHIASAVLFIGPATAAASRFPGHALAAGDRVGGGGVDLLRGITRAYATSSLAVSIFGVALAAEGGYWDQRWLQVAIAVHAAGLVVLLGVVVPRQHRVCERLEAGHAIASRDVATLRGATGAFSLTWVVVLGLMVVKPSW